MCTVRPGPVFSLRSFLIEGSYFFRSLIHFSVIVLVWCEFRLQLHCHVCLVFAFRDVKHAGVSRFSLKSELLWLPTYCILQCCKTCNPWTIPLSSRLSSNLACLYRWLQLPLIAWVLTLGSTSLGGLVQAGIFEISSSNRGFQMSSLFTWWSCDGGSMQNLRSSCHLPVLLSLWLLCAWDAITLTSPLEVLLFWPNFLICFTSCS